jgi:hypothetical protein
MRQQGFYITSAIMPFTRSISIALSFYFIGFPLPIILNTTKSEKGAKAPFSLVISV